MTKNNIAKKKLNKGILKLRLTKKNFEKLNKDEAKIKLFSKKIEYRYLKIKLLKVSLHRENFLKLNTDFLLCI